MPTVPVWEAHDHVGRRPRGSTPRNAGGRHSAADDAATLKPNGVEIGAAGARLSGAQPEEGAQ